MPASKLAVAAWVTSAAAVVSAATAGVYALAATSNSTSTGTATAAAAKTPTPTPTPNGNSQGNNGNGVGNGGSTGTQASNHPIVVTGQVIGAPAPGRTGTLNVKVDNSKNQAILVRSIIATVTSVTAVTPLPAPGKPACDKSWYSIAPFNGSFPIGAGATGVVPLTITFDDKPGINQDNCKSATFNFSYTATADQA